MAGFIISYRALTLLVAGVVAVFAVMQVQQMILVGSIIGCQDGVYEASLEGCDDGNSTNGDGCSSTCQVETGYTCEIDENNCPGNMVLGDPDQEVTTRITRVDSVGLYGPSGNSPGRALVIYDRNNNNVYTSYARVVDYYPATDNFINAQSNYTILEGGRQLTSLYVEKMSNTRVAVAYTRQSDTMNGYIKVVNPGVGSPVHSAYLRQSTCRIRNLTAFGSNIILVCYNGKAIVAEPDGNSLDFGDVQSFATTSASVANAEKIDSQRIVLTYVEGGEIKAVVGRVNGQSITFYTPVTVANAGGVVPQPVVTTIGTNTAYIAYFDQSRNVKMRKLTVNYNNTITLGPESDHGRGNGNAYLKQYYVTGGAVPRMVLAYPRKVVSIPIIGTNLGTDQSVNVTQTPALSVLSSNFMMISYSGNNQYYTHQAIGAPCPSECTAVPVCGNGAIETDEDCDDNHTTNGDGCDSTCNFETGWQCTGEPSNCLPVCGDGLIRGDETCDDTNTQSGDGCSATCKEESGWTCVNIPSSCTRDPVCGNGLIETGETCDDNNTNANDGCSDSCAIETGWTCNGEPSSCDPICGDGLIRGTEACDDDNTDNGDGCSDQCVIETGWMCHSEASICETVCGDEIIAGAETCDDQNTDGGDGCSDVCQIEDGCSCTQEPSQCICIDPQCTNLPNPPDGYEDLEQIVTDCEAYCKGDQEGDICCPIFPWATAEGIQCACFDGDVAAIDGLDLVLEPVQRDQLNEFRDQCELDCSAQQMSGKVFCNYGCGGTDMCDCKCAEPACNHNYICDPGESNVTCPFDCFFDNVCVQPGYSFSCTARPTSSVASSVGTSTPLSSVATSSVTSSVGTSFPIVKSISSEPVVKSVESSSDLSVTPSSEAVSSTVSVAPSSTADSSVEASSAGTSFPIVKSISSEPEVKSTESSSEVSSEAPSSEVQSSDSSVAVSSVVATSASQVSSSNSSLVEHCVAVPFPPGGYDFEQVINACETYCRGDQQGDICCPIYPWATGDGIQCACVPGDVQDLPGVDLTLTEVPRDQLNEYRDLCTNACAPESGRVLCNYGCGGTDMCACVCSDDPCNHNFICEQDQGETPIGCPLDCFFDDMCFNIEFDFSCPVTDEPFDPTSSAASSQDSTVTSQISVSSIIIASVSSTVSSQQISDVASSTDDGSVSSNDTDAFSSHTSESNTETSATSQSIATSNQSSDAPEALSSQRQSSVAVSSAETSSLATTVQSSQPTLASAATTSRQIVIVVESRSSSFSWYIDANHCGNGQDDPFEHCDDGNNIDGDGCSRYCLLEYRVPDILFCGDGVIQAQEQCDDGNNANGDGCSSDCFTEGTIYVAGQYCGDGQFEGNEECDDGNRIGGDGCSAHCLFETATITLPGGAKCGDGVTTPPETCDDGNLRDGDGCTSYCMRNRGLVYNCGDGILQELEQCDDGNTESNDGCSSDCFLEGIISLDCGDGILTSNEQCDKAHENSDVDGNACRTDCTLPRCGDGVIDEGYGEECDNGDRNGKGLCTAECTVWRCGNRTLDAGEQCDDGNLNDGDGCSATCFIEQKKERFVQAIDICGDGIVQDGEECDDGNTDPSDGCNRYCERVEKPTLTAAREKDDAEVQKNVQIQRADVRVGSVNQLLSAQPHMQQVLQHQAVNVAFPTLPTTQSIAPQLPLAQLQPLVTSRGPVGDTGPAAIAITGAGLAAGLGWVRRRRK